MKQQLQPGGVLIVHLEPADIKTPQSLYGEFQRLIVDDEMKRILVDLSAIADANSLMIGALIALHLLAYEHLAVLKFSGLRPKIKMLFDMLGVTRVLESHYARGEPTDSFRVADGPPGTGR